MQIESICIDTVKRILQTCSAKFWQMMRQEFHKLLLLSELTDSILSPMVFAVVIFETINMTLYLYLMLT